MTALAASIADTVAGMQRVIEISHYSSDSDEIYLQPSNRGNKLKRKANLISGGSDERLDKQRAYGKTIKHAGHTRDILHRNPKLYDEHGEELATDEENAEAVTRAEEENPYAGIQLESLLAPLTNASSLPNHPSMSASYTSTTLSDMVEHARNLAHREKKSLSNAKEMLTKLRGDDTWIPAGHMQTDYDDGIFDTKPVYDLIIASTPVNGSQRKARFGTNGSLSRRYSHSKVAIAASEDRGARSIGQQPNEQASDTLIAIEIAEEITNADKSVTGLNAALEDADNTPKPHVKPETHDEDRNNLETIEAIRQDGVLITKHSNIGDGSESTSIQQPSSHQGDGSRLPCTVKNGQEPDTLQESLDGNRPDEKVDEDGAESHSPPRRVTRAQAQADKVTASLHSESPADWVPPPIHPLFLIPPSAEPDADLGLPPAEAMETRQLLAAYVQKQEEICRGAEGLYEKMLRAERQRQTVFKWCKAEAHIGELSDGEDWYDKEEWGLEEDLRKGHMEEEEDAAAQGKKTRVHFRAGLYTGLLAATLLQPADLLKTRLQQPNQGSAPLLSTLRSVLNGPNGHGVRGLWRGTLPSLIRTGLGSALYYSSLNALRSRMSLVFASAPDVRTPVTEIGASSGGGVKSSSSLPRLSKSANLLTGAVARAAAGFVLMPATVVKVRYESTMYTYRSLLDAYKAILKQDGPRGFFKGAGATAVRDAPFAGLYLVVYEECKGRLNRTVTPTEISQADGLNGNMEGRGMKRSTAFAINSASAVVGATVASALTNPFDAVKTRLQLMPKRYANMLDTASMMVKEEGWRCLMQGMGLRTGRKVISLALSWTLYEEFVRSSEAKRSEKL